jgi:hypothetical protein
MESSGKNQNRGLEISDLFLNSLLAANALSTGYFPNRVRFQEEADKLAFWTVIFSGVLSLMASRLADAFQRHLKVALYILLATSSAMFLWILLLDDRVLVFHKGELYAAVILAISTSWSTPALFLELASEIAFPVSEAIVGGYMIFLSNLVGALFYFSYFLPWMSKRTRDALHILIGISDTHSFLSLNVSIECCDRISGSIIEEYVRCCIVTLQIL